MKYFKAISERYDWFNKEGTKTGELFTEKERNTKVRYITDFWFEEVDVPKSRVVFVDGKRFDRSDV